MFYAGDEIFAEGDEGNWAYLIQTGKIEIYKKSPDGKEHSLAMLGHGRLFGEMALIDSLPRMASARAVETTTVILVSNEVLQASLAKVHPLVRELMRNLSNNLRSVTREHLKKTKEPPPDEHDRPYPPKTHL